MDVRLIGGNTSVKVAMLIGICVSTQSLVPVCAKDLHNTNRVNAVHTRAFNESVKTTAAPRIAQSVANETPDAFVNRFLVGYANARGPKDVEPFLTQEMRDRKPKEEGPASRMKAEEEMINAFFQMSKQNVPRKASIASQTEKNGKLYVTLKTIEYDPAIAAEMKKPGSSMTSKLVLQKTTAGWAVADMYFKQVTASGMTSKIGTDPDEAQTPVAKSPLDAYTDGIMDAVKKVWKAPSTGEGAVNVELQNTATGKYTFIGVKDKKGSADAENLVKQALTNLELPPLPASEESRPIVDLQIIWNDKSDGVVVQHFSTPMLQTQASAPAN